MSDTLKIVQKGEKKEGPTDVFLHTSLRIQNPGVRVFIPLNPGPYNGGWPSTGGHNEYLAYVPLYSGNLVSIGIRTEYTHLGNVTMGFHMAPTGTESPPVAPVAEISANLNNSPDDYLYKFDFGPNHAEEVKWTSGAILAFSLTADNASANYGDMNVTIHLQQNTKQKHWWPIGGSGGYT